MRFLLGVLVSAAALGVATWAVSGIELLAGRGWTRVGTLEIEGEGPLIVREKTHAAVPMALDQAFYEMELVGHDFYLFMDSDTGQPSVVYQRHGYDYGVIHLKLEE